MSVLAGPRPADQRTAVPAIHALQTLLEQLRDVLSLLPTAAYVARPAAAVSGSVGEHVRHCLDHVTALAQAMDGDTLSYDARKRGTTVETDPVTAINEIERLFSRMAGWSRGYVDRTIHISALVDAEAPPALMRTTLARELAFLVQHTVHHCAVIAVLLDTQGWRVPRGFGLAPSTVHARARAR
jgi:uncharacterized damage-inducible protein DinB